MGLSEKVNLMRSLEFLDPEVTQKLLEGHQDILTKEAEDSEEFYSAQSCPRCGGSCRKTGDGRTLFSQRGVLPQFYLQCLACNCEFDPRTGLIHVLGNLGKAVEPAIPILGKGSD